MICMCFVFKDFMLLLLTVFQGKFHGNPMHVAVVISNCLREERRILAAANMPIQGPLEKSLQSSSVSERQRNVEHKVSAIKNSVQVSGLI